nr:hypothetical protein [Tanacetum cinerariifolium]
MRIRLRRSALISLQVRTKQGKVDKTTWVSGRHSLKKGRMLQPKFQTNVKSRSIDGGFVASVVGGGMDVDCCGGRVKDGKDCEMAVENTYEESEITETDSEPDLLTSVSCSKSDLCSLSVWVLSSSLSFS